MRLLDQYLSSAYIRTISVYLRTMSGSSPANYTDLNGKDGANHVAKLLPDRY
ncbi:hypothetical protein MES4922_240001 [Mesorhizobium ventifaucium]|uniref:Uncharacterized protein n=1 Tax=Mesorhizobium ventifaucium TaxID=666020 RepID=A0ABM9DW75_9HYPH|nr:hypothetical protein MES4922_240001 [Mesorhizobium ventifaucium]